MRPLPTTTQAAPLATKPAVSTAVSQTLELGPLHHSTVPAQNRRAATSCAVQRAYPWLLIASTALAAVFCGLYLNKPVIVAGPGPGPAATTIAPAPPVPAMIAAAPKAADSLLPRGGHLPGDTAKPQAADPKRLASAGSGSETAFEETNLRIQHVLKAQGPGGEDLGKLTLDVPVLYRSRALRWTPEEIARARNLMTRIGHYQEAAQIVRNEGTKLLGEWNALVGESIPTPVLRADSPSLGGAPQASTGEPLDSTQAIEIKNR
ncbi:hypothetical protein [Luteolibacter soli]|uniref:Uncharacterized protein n=1 Tax=Luteolibacter soli TaxID=3135280 RepID=A0ABU9AQW1_9BACT